MKLKTLLCAVLTACSSAAMATNFFVVVPNKAKAAQAADKTTVSLASVSLPQGRVGQAYPGFDFNTLLTVTGDPAFSGAGVTWSAVSLPVGFSLSATGLLSGTPVQANPAGSSITVKADYRVKSGSRAYTLVVNDVVLHVAQLSAGATHNCALTIAGDVMCWGEGAYGKLGNGLTSNSASPVKVQGLAPGSVVEVGAGSAFSCARLTDATVKCWGRNNFAQLGTGDTVDSLVPVSVTGIGASVAQLSVGSNFACVVTTSGGAKCWGSNAGGRLGNGTAVTQSGAPVDVVGLSSSVSRIVAGSSNACAITTGGALKCWGMNGQGSLGNNSTANSSVPVDVIGLSSGVTDVAMGNNGCALVNGTVKCWGGNDYGQLGDGTLTERWVPVDVIGLPSGGIKKLAARNARSCALMSNGTAYCWGYNGWAAFGDGTTNSSTTPVAVQGLANPLTDLQAGIEQTCGKLTDGTVQCWGGNEAGQVGTGAITPKEVLPVRVVSP